MIEVIDTSDTQECLRRLFHEHAAMADRIETLEARIVALEPEPEPVEEGFPEPPAPPADDLKETLDDLGEKVEDLAEKVEENTEAVEELNETVEEDVDADTDMTEAIEDHAETIEPPEEHHEDEHHEPEHRERSRSRLPMR